MVAINPALVCSRCSIHPCACVRPRYHLETDAERMLDRWHNRPWGVRRKQEDRPEMHKRGKTKADAR